MTSTASEEVSIIKASNMLQAKVGRVQLDTRKVEASQKMMDNNQVDFAPLGVQFLDELAEILDKADELRGNPAFFKEKVTEPVMQLKANAKMFKYDLVGDLATIMLSFLEEVREVDQDVLDIIGAHVKTLRLLISQRMTGENAALSKTLTNELKSLCSRYFKKQNIKVSDIFLVE